MGGGDDPNSNSSITYRLSPDISVIPISCEKPSSHTKKKLEPLLGKENIEFHSIKRDSSNLINISLSPIVLSTEKFDGFFSSKSSCQPLYNREECDSEKYPLWPSGLPVSPHANFQIHFPITKKRVFVVVTPCSCLNEFIRVSHQHKSCPDVSLSPLLHPWFVGAYKSYLKLVYWWEGIVHQHQASSREL